MVRSLVERVFDVAHDRSQLAFVAVDGREHTLGELEAIVTSRSELLRGLGVGAGVPVAFFAGDGLDLPLSYLAVIAAGGIAVPVNNQFGPGDVEAVAEILGEAIWLSDSSRAPVLDAALAAVHRAHHVYDIDSFELLAGTPVEPGMRRTSTVPHDPADPVDVLAFTSGTTGSPKGACLSRSALDAALTSSARSYRFGSDTVLLYTAAMAFVPTVLTQLLGALAVGGRVHLLRSRDCSTWLEQAEQVGATFTYVPTPELGDFARTADQRGGVPSLRTIFHAGSAVPPEVMEDALGVFGDRMLEAWGMTETCGAPITVTVEGDSAELGPARFALTVGRAVPEARVRLDVDEGEGELLVAAPFLCRGYLGVDGFEPIDRAAFPTGDLGRIDDGFVAITGRRKELIITGGINVSPVEVELCIASMDGIAEAAVFGVDDPRWGEAVNVAVVPAPDAQVDPDAIVTFVKSRLAPYKAPKAVHVVSELPRTASHKIMRHVLRERFNTPHEGAPNA